MRIVLGLAAVMLALSMGCEKPEVKVEVDGKEVEAANIKVEAGKDGTKVEVTGKDGKVVVDGADAKVEVKDGAVKVKVEGDAAKADDAKKEEKAAK